MQEKIKVGMIGGGQGAFIGAVHRHAMALDGHYSLVCGAFSRSASNNKQTAEQLGIAHNRTYEDWASMLQAEQALPPSEAMQMVVVVTPNHLHVPISVAAVRAGFHVFCEKPAGISSAEVVQLQNTLAQSSALYGLAHTYLGYPMVWQAKHMVNNGQLGAIRKVLVEYPQGWLSAKQEDSSKQARWRTDPSQSGVSGCMGDIGTHAFGLAEFVTAQKVTQLCADLHSHINGRLLDDDGAALLRFNQGASGTLMASQVCLGEENALKLRVYGEKGAVEWSQMDPNSLIYRCADQAYQVLRAGKGQPGLCTEAETRCRIPAGHPEGYIEAMANLYSHFADAIRQGKTGTAAGVPGISAGLRGMQFIECIVASSQSNEKWQAFEDKTAAEKLHE